MPIISVTTWDGQDEAQAQELTEELTGTVRRVTGAPVDEATARIQEVPRNRWAGGGAPGSGPKFPEPSRRLAG